MFLSQLNSQDFLTMLLGKPCQFFNGYARKIWEKFLPKKSSENLEKIFLYNSNQLNNQKEEDKMKLIRKEAIQDLIRKSDNNKKITFNGDNINELSLEYLMFHVGLFENIHKLDNIYKGTRRYYPECKELLEEKKILDELVFLTNSPILSSDNFYNTLEQWRDSEWYRSRPENNKLGWLPDLWHKEDLKNVEDRFLEELKEENCLEKEKINMSLETLRFLMSKIDQNNNSYNYLYIYNMNMVNFFN